MIIDPLFYLAIAGEFLREYSTQIFIMIIIIILTLNYFYQCLEKANSNSVFIFDDIYWSKGMTEAWETIKAHPKVTVTLDLFQLGIVFFRTEQAKQHFVLKY